MRTSSSTICAVSSEYGRCDASWPSEGGGYERWPTFSDMPKLVTMSYANRVTFWRSSCAPVEMLPKKTFSAMRPPSIMHIWSIICSLVCSFFSLGTYCA